MIAGLKYLENTLDLYIQKNSVIISITSSSRRFPLSAAKEDGTLIPFGKYLNLSAY